MSTKKTPAAVDPNEGARVNGAFDLPERILIVGVDPIPPEIAEAVSHLEDPERDFAPDPGLVSSIAAHGVRKHVPVMTFKLARAWEAPWGPVRSGDRVRVAIDGRQRIRATRLVNIKYKDDYPRRVGYYVVNDSDLMDPTIHNEFARVDSIMAKARKVKRLMGRGLSIPQIATGFGDGHGSIVSEATIRNWILLTTLTPAEQAAIDAGTMTPTEGYDLARGRKNGKGSAPESEEEEEGDDKPTRTPSKRPPTPKKIRALLEALTPGTEDAFDPAIDAAGAVLRWVLGEEPDCADEFIQTAMTKGKAPAAPAKSTPRRRRIATEIL